MADARHYCDYALLPSGWVKNVQFTVDGNGQFREVKQCARIDAERRIGRIVVPGMPNVHSHAFQRAMAGLAEHAGKSSDTFWTWREVMYRFAAHIEPDDLEAIAAQLYVEMLKAGYAKRLASGVVCAGGTLDALIPPSVNPVTYVLEAARSLIAGDPVGVALALALGLALAGVMVLWALRGLRRAEAGAS